MTTSSLAALADRVEVAPLPDGADLTEVVVAVTVPGRGTFDMAEVLLATLDRIEGATP